MFNSGNFAKIIEAASNPLGLIALIILVCSSLAHVFFRRENIYIKILIFFMFFLGGCLFSYSVYKGISLPKETKGKIIVLMDSILKVNIYDEENQRLGKINSHTINDILHEIPLLSAKIVIEPTKYEWDREDDILNLHPDLIIVHYSAFERETIGYNDEIAIEKFKSFLRYMNKSKAKFIVYTRGTHFDKEDDRIEFINSTGLSGRLYFFSLSDKPHTFKDPVKRRRFKILVKKVLNLS